MRIDRLKLDSFRNYGRQAVDFDGRCNVIFGENAQGKTNLLEALRYAPADTVKIELNTGVSPAIIVPTEGEENFLYMVLPVRLKSAE